MQKRRMGIIEKIRDMVTQRSSLNGVDANYAETVEQEADLRIANLVEKVKKIDVELEGLKVYKQDIKNCEDRLNKRREKILTFIELILTELKRHGGGNDLHFVTLAKKRKSVEITDKDLVPDEFVSRYERVISKTLIRQSVDAGNPAPPGAKVVGGDDGSTYPKIRKNRQRRS